MDDVVPPTPLALMLAQGLFQFLLVAIVQFNEVDAFILEKFTARCCSHRSPSVIAALECLLDKKSADKATGTSDKDTFHDSTSPDSCLLFLAMASLVPLVPFLAFFSTASITC